MSDNELIKLYETTLISVANEPATKMMNDARKAALRAVFYAGFDAGRQAELEALTPSSFTPGMLRRLRGVYNPCEKCSGMGVVVHHGEWKPCEACSGLGDARGRR